MTKGNLTFENVTMRYRQNTEVVLSNLSFMIKSGSKIGIVGRTGAGKSSLAQVLARIVELEKGRILMDGKDISKIKLSELRKIITFIPQDPSMFTGTLRFNLDPNK